ncbi:MAG: hypothetical protein JWN31_121 [Frankiales bacterium]|nr:hypothetical protein [Frankiales bacterium]
MTLPDTERFRQDRALIERLIDDPSPLGPDFAPIRRLSDGALIAYKATGSAQRDTRLDTMLTLLASAQSNGLMERLDWAFRCLALDVALDKAITCELHLTPEPETFATMCPPRLATSFGRGRRQIKVGAEVHAAAFATTALEEAANEWRGYGWKVIVADVSELYDRDFLKRLAGLHPDVVQVDLNKPRRESDVGVLETISWAQANNVEVHALGVDNELRRQQAIDLGAVAGRGWFYGEPGPL